MLNNYDIRINFNGFTCWSNELMEYLRTINFVGSYEGELLFYSSSSVNACYNFDVIKIDNDIKIVELIAISE